MLLVILFHGSRSCTGHLRAAAAEATWGRAHCLQLSVDLAVSAYLTERGVAAGGDDTFLNVVALDHTVAKNHGGVADEAIAHAEQAIVVGRPEMASHWRPIWQHWKKYTSMQLPQSDRQLQIPSTHWVWGRIICTPWAMAACIWPCILANCWDMFLSERLACFESGALGENVSEEDTAGRSSANDS